MKKIIYFVIFITLSCFCSCQLDDENVWIEPSGMKIGNDSIELGGVIFYIDSDCCWIKIDDYAKCGWNDPVWCPYDNIISPNSSISISTPKIGTSASDGEKNTRKIDSVFGYCQNPNYVSSDSNIEEPYQHGSHWYSSGVARYLNEKKMYGYDDWYVASINEIVTFSTFYGCNALPSYSACGPHLYSSSTETDSIHYYSYDTGDQILRKELKNTARYPMIMRKHYFNKIY